MIIYTKGNLLHAKVEALVNTVNTVGIMGKGIALMFKERFALNFKKYADACREGRVEVGTMFITQTGELEGPDWIVNFPTKKHWKGNSRIEWITEGLNDLREFIISHEIKSIAIPPLGAGNGGLKWSDVKPLIEHALGDLPAEIYVYEPTAQYQNVAKKEGVEKLTPARALIVHIIRQYWVAGLECSLLEIQKMAWFMERSILALGMANPLRLQFKAHKYGPYSYSLIKVLEALDGSYLNSDKRITDSNPSDLIWPNESKLAFLDAYLQSEAKQYLEVAQIASEIIEGFESAYGLELLSTVDWLVQNNQATLEVDSIRSGLMHWPAGKASAQRKVNLFNDHSIAKAIDRLRPLESIKQNEISLMN
ncbi:O-acetyl-ADP-ribose deacetylase (regulator of RNase III), contains Macro domain [Methylobacillus rhizosphaerae]|uniref:O-acetyl-ADP-ribose deacetylase (Regulator of RNase III), contains Macro domain n=1 Tax=Methylobacillus rhizosphaerae TaxID=551994 RepID=A0A238XXI4_9PROT|nr:macro domain-containing protein [Methylobacillus rhizosphaerae]SNR63133.1 O-acetyl-ADP-ribose deacetylase (regulator of RNase III), contains Macro domain [Methylobacillus rhizosphaerae]